VRIPVLIEPGPGLSFSQAGIIYVIMKPWQKLFLAVTVAIVLLCILMVILPPIRDRVVFRAEQLRIRLQYTLFPPERAVFTPNAEVALAVQSTMTQIALAATPIPTLTITLTPTQLPPDLPTPTLTIAPTPLPASHTIENVPYIDQHYGYNNCAPANLAMAMTFWGWTGKREDVTTYVKPFVKDKNVMPYELVDYVNSQTNLRALTRFGGTSGLVKNLLVSGFPVVVERGVYLRDLSGKISWMGHYQVVYGYNDDQAIYQVQDSFEQDGNHFSVSYDDLIRGWRSFNYTFIVVYPAEREAELMTILGSYADENSAGQAAAAIASADIFSTEGQDQFFAWYNRGSSLVWLQDYVGASDAYDEAFGVYAGLSAENRPWRATWYQTGPYFAYFYTGRYQDVVSLADQTISSASEPYLEESFYWRARGKAALGDTKGAVEDLRKSLEYHPGFSPALQVLEQMGVTP
jgi:hypothetical protein